MYKTTYNVRSDSCVDIPMESIAHKFSLEHYFAGSLFERYINREAIKVYLRRATGRINLFSYQFLAGAPPGDGKTCADCANLFCPICVRDSIHLELFSE